MNNMDPEFKKFLDTNCKKQNKVTHVAPTIGSYTVKEDNLEQFYKYCQEEFFKKHTNSSEFSPKPKNEKSFFEKVKEMFN